MRKCWKRNFIEKCCKFHRKELVDIAGGHNKTINRDNIMREAEMDIVQNCKDSAGLTTDLEPNTKENQ